MKNLNKKGFTMIELLITIAITSLILILCFYSINNVITTSKNKSNTIAINSLKTSANNYLKEFPNEINWDINLENSWNETCISTQTLISKGYLDKNKFPPA